MTIPFPEYGVSVRRLACWDSGVAGSNPVGARMSVCCVVCCQVEASASLSSLGQRSPNVCGASEYDRKALMMRMPWPARGCCAIKKLTQNYVFASM